MSRAAAENVWKQPLTERKLTGGSSGRPDDPNGMARCHLPEVNPWAF